MHPTTIEFLARDRIADLYRQATQPHVPETPEARHEPGPRVRIGTALATVGRRLLRPGLPAVR